MINYFFKSAVAFFLLMIAAGHAQEAKADPLPPSDGGRVFLLNPDVFYFDVSYTYTLNAHIGDVANGIFISALFCNNPVRCSSIGAKVYTIPFATLGDGDVSDGGSNSVPEIHGTRSTHYGTLTVSEILKTPLGSPYRDWTITAYANILPKCQSNFESCDSVSAVTDITVKVRQDQDTPPISTRKVSKIDNGIEKVPAPAPLLGAAAAFGSIRRAKKLSIQLKTFTTI